MLGITDHDPSHVARATTAAYSLERPYACRLQVQGSYIFCVGPNGVQVSRLLW
jgi:hypothetical protein